MAAATGPTWVSARSWPAPSKIKELRRVEAQRIPADIDYSKLTGLRLEAKEKLAAVRPENLGQAARISGVNPADVAALHILLESL